MRPPEVQVDVSVALDNGSLKRWMRCVRAEEIPTRSTRNLWAFGMYKKYRYESIQTKSARYRWKRDINQGLIVVKPHVYMRLSIGLNRLNNKRFNRLEKLDYAVTTTSSDLCKPTTASTVKPFAR